MPRTRIALSLVVALSLVAGCSFVRVTDVEFDESHDFSGYQRFDFLEGLRVETGDERTDSPVVHDFLRRSIVETMTEKGYTYVEDGEVDFHVGYMITIQTRMAAGARRGAPVGYGYESLASYGTESWSYTAIDDYDEGTLVIDVIDRPSRRSVWRGVARGEVRDVPTYDSATKGLSTAVDKVLGNFPPER